MPSLTDFTGATGVLRAHLEAQRAARLGARPKWFVTDTGATSYDVVKSDLRTALGKEGAIWEEHSKALKRDERTTGARLRVGWLAVLLRDVSRILSPSALNISAYSSTMAARMDSWRTRTGGVIDRQVAQLQTIRAAGERV